MSIGFVSEVVFGTNYLSVLDKSCFGVGKRQLWENSDLPCVGVRSSLEDKSYMLLLEKSC